MRWGAERNGDARDWLVVPVTHLNNGLDGGLLSNQIDSILALEHNDSDRRVTRIRIAGECTRLARKRFEKRSR
jgi:hypothetical protein